MEERTAQQSTIMKQLEGLFRGARSSAEKAAILQTIKILNPEEYKHLEDHILRDRVLGMSMSELLQLVAKHRGVNIKEAEVLLRNLVFDHLLDRSKLNILEGTPLHPPAARVPTPPPVARPAVPRPPVQVPVKEPDPQPEPLLEQPPAEPAAPVIEGPPSVQESLPPQGAEEPRIVPEEPSPSRRSFLMPRGVEGQ